MSERKFMKVLSKPGSAAAVRENVSAAVRHTTLMVRPLIVEPLDYEELINKMRTILQNDPQRELLLFPMDDFEAKTLNRLIRTTRPVPYNNHDFMLSSKLNLDTNLLPVSLHVRQCIDGFLRDWSVIEFKYEKYSGSWTELPKLPRLTEEANLLDQVYEIDDEEDGDREPNENVIGGITKEGYILRGSETATSAFMSMTSKSFKRRWMCLRPEIDNTYVLEFFKDQRKTESKGSIHLDLCHQVVRNPRRGKWAFELRMIEGHKCVILATELETDLDSWLEALNRAISNKSETASRKSVALSEGISTPPPTLKYGTLRNLEFSKNPELMKYSRETEYTIAQQRKEGRVNVFMVYPDLQSRRGSFIELKYRPNKKVEPYREQFGFRFIFTCDTFDFNLKTTIEGNTCHIEPFFTSVAVFDAKRGKITEEFRFDVNNDLVKEMLPKGKLERQDSMDMEDAREFTDDWIVDPKSAIFSIHSPSTDMFLVLRVEKVLTGSISSTSDGYIKSTENGAGKLGVKMHKTAKATCQRMGTQYRMPFAWAAKPLFKSTKCLDTSSDFGSIYRQENNRLSDEDLIKHLNELKNNEKLRNVTVIPGKISCSLKELSTTVTNDIPDTVLTSSHLPVVPFKTPPIEPAIIEVQEFLLTNPRIASPSTHYVNLLYVFPKCLKYDSQKFFAKARNICCAIEFRDSDEESALPLPVIFGRPCTSNREFVSRVTTSITHHSSNPEFYEEVKIALPVVLHEKQHLLFSFYHVSCSTSSHKKKESSIETPIGYSWLPIYPNRGKLNLEEQSISVSSHLPPGYLSYKPLGLGKGFSGPEIRWVDGGRELFKVGFKFVSSIFPSDPHLHSFLVHVDKILDMKRSEAGREISKFVQIQHGMPKILKNLQDSEISDIIRFFPVLMTQLLRLLMATTSEDVSLNIVRIIIDILHRIHSVNKEEVTQSYVEYVFTSESLFTSNSKTTLHEELIRSLVSLLRSSFNDFMVINNLLSHCWFFLQIAVKSMVNHLLTSGRIKMLRNERFPQEYHTNLSAFIDLIMPQIMHKYRGLPSETKLANKALAFFLTRCLSLMDRGFVFRLIKLYLDKFHTARDSVALHNYKFEFIAIITAYEHHVPLNLPINGSSIKAKTSPGSETATKENPIAISDSFTKTHFIVGIILQEVRSALIEVHQVRGMAISVLRNLLVKHSFDDRYQYRQQQSRIASLYFPFISVLLDNINRIHVSGFSSAIQHLINDNNNSTRISSPHKSSTLNCLNSSKRVSFFDTYSLASLDTIDGTTKSNSLRRNSTLESTSKLLSTANRDSSYLQYIAGTIPITNVGLSVVTNSPGSSFFPGSSDELSVDGPDSSSKSPSPDPDNHSKNVTSALSQQTNQLQLISQQGHLSLGKMSTTNNPSTDSRSTSPANMDNKDINHHHQRSQSLPVRFDKLNNKEVRDLLIIHLWIIKHVTEDMMTKWLHQASDVQIIQILTLTEMCLFEFKYSGRKYSTKRSGASDKANTLPSRISSNMSSQTSIGPRFEDNESNENHITHENVLFSSLLEANLATEVGLIALDQLGLITSHLKDRISGNEGDNPLMKKIFSIYLTFLQLGQSETLLKHLFASLRGFVNKFPSVLFSGNPNLVGKLCLELLRCSSSRIVTVRNESSALLYLLMRANFDHSNGLSMTRMHLQVIISISRLLGDSGLALMNNPRFQESLAVINNYAGSDKGMQGGRFPSLVKELTKKVRTVLMATAAMREHENDSEMLLDLQHHLANSYAETSPALRRTWLESMAKNHIKNNNFSEAAQCLAHIAALEAEYLRNKNQHQLGAKAFSSISLNIPRDEELSNSTRRDESNSDEEQFSEESLLSSLESAVDLFTRAERYEVVPEIYKIMAPFYEKARNYEILSRIHRNISEIYDKILITKKSGKRLLGRYYKVAFFGKDYFEDDSGREYIYKEPKVTSLPEISQRLKDLFSSKFGPTNVKLIMSEKEIDEKKDCDPRYAYIQITHVVPYSHVTDPSDDRITDFEKVNNVNKFMFETPFSLIDPSKARSSDCEEQCKKRTILVTKYCLPYVVKRVPIVSKSVQILSPIEVAIDEMEIRVKQLEEVAFSDSPDLKRLQLTLQGSVSVQVNSGPLTYAKAFLNETKNYPISKVTKLRQFYRQFISVCEVCLQLNERLIASDQHEYQQSLRKNFDDMVEELRDCCQLDVHGNVGEDGGLSNGGGDGNSAHPSETCSNNNNNDIANGPNGANNNGSRSILDNNNSETDSGLSIGLKNYPLEIFDFISGSSNA
ncbi:dedicator of cytokinesis protein 9-like isoform X2 [Panonychus citri]|uniref:dedicator of cytokinesis protein 9-like isoform X2 n=1 Tax=Panonychus citri TaxID=50023 RepID=UPI002307205D|nr:dedicator of cytokinesis protein 9-like isoform X2 [Panonychus citri]